MPKCRLRRSRKLVVFFSATLLLIAPGGYFGFVQLTGNFHAVIAGEVYRSAQPTADDIAAHVHRQGIRSVLNLRGSHVGTAWYDEEVAASDRLGIRHIDLQLSAHRELSDAEITRLEEIMRSAPKPLLIHCKSGADRTGLAAALYLLAVLHGRPGEAAGQLSWVYGHFPFFGSRSVAMDQSFEHAAAAPRVPASLSR
jgi:protein tyrosine/serine phosphatase